jgi:hypothetical protein
MDLGQGPQRVRRPTIFRPMYSQPGRTDSRKAFLWAPSENRAWLQGGAFPSPPLPALSWGEGMSLLRTGVCIGAEAKGKWVTFCICFFLSLAMCLGPGHNP